MALRPADWFVVAAAAALVGAVTVWTWTPTTPARVAEIRSPTGNVTLALTDNQHVSIEGFIGTSEIELVGGRARFAEAPCRNRVCIAAGWLAVGGDFAACAPNGVSILLRAGDERYDAINY
ncbi:MAG: NusG domain II-containing protein [Gammaproteobacteria bacterium]